MDYAKRYNEALERAKKLRDGFDGYTANVAIIEQIFPELKESEDERVRKKIIEIIRMVSGPDCDVYLSEKGQAECLAWLEKQKEQKPAEWSEEDQLNLNWVIAILNGEPCDLDIQVESLIYWLKSLRPQPREEIYKAAIHDLAIRFMNYLDENRAEGKMGLSNSECVDINKAFAEKDWGKIIRYANKYQPHWKPSEEQMAALLNTLLPGRGIDCDVISSLYDDLMKLM